jgi:hypothetical protein
MHSVALDMILLINIIVGIYIYIYKVSIPGRPDFNKIDHPWVRDKDV